MARYRGIIDLTARYAFEFEAGDDARAERILALMQGGVRSGDVDERGDVTKLSTSATGRVVPVAELGTGEEDGTEVTFVRFGAV